MWGYSVSGRVAVVTGGVLGIGSGVVSELLEENVKHVAIFDVIIEEGKAVEKKLNDQYGAGKVTLYKCDVSNQDELQCCFDKVLKDKDKIDIVCNVAGIYNEKQYARMIDINVTGVIGSTLKAIELMSAQNGGEGGVIVNVASIAALGPTHLFPVYGATKSAVLSISNSMGLEAVYSRTKVRVIAACPGRVDTRLAVIQKEKIWNSEYYTEIKEMFKGSVDQTISEAAKAFMHVLKEGRSGSTWTIADGKSKDVTDITSGSHIDLAKFFP